jgi:hypothetical protein
MGSSTVRCCGNARINSFACQGTVIRDVGDEVEEGGHGKRQYVLGLNKQGNRDDVPAA